ncbi:hypothetical protein L596_018660 [Steinernema carpocapsae]|uniref:SKP1 component POZ domain-containing protein n=1 Tax=Steinernema carpocapsae TaxID=34508 RepID=A0A4U5N651_STECR|nr:hypothetical protein L596_018660 [Steinernema carpocapsae]
MDESTIELISKEGNIVTIKRRLVKKSGTIQTLLEDLGYEAEDAGKPEPIPVPNCEEKHIRMIAEWLRLHEIDAPIDEEQRGINHFNLTIPKEDREMFEKTHIDDIAYLMIAANYLEITDLIENLAKYTAKVIDDNNDSADSIMKALNLTKN